MDNTKCEYKQERVAAHSVAKILNDRGAEGWEYVEIVERVAAPQFRNAGNAGPGMTVVLLRKAR
jgi:hypothetical protein